jgi:hypothetical protein
LLVIGAADAVEAGPWEVSHRSPGGVVETCKRLAPFPFRPAGLLLDKRAFSQRKDWYRDQDSEVVDRLCSVDLYAARSTKKRRARAVCPKLKGSSPGLEIYDLKTARMSKRRFERKVCRIMRRKRWSRRRIRKTSVYKTTVFGRERQATLLYFHFSRLLGNIALVPPSTSRTVSAREYTAWSRRGLRYMKKIGKKTELASINTIDGWDVLVGLMTVSPRRVRGRQVMARHRLLVPGRPHLVRGTITRNVRGESEHRALCYHGRIEFEKAASYRKAPYYRLVRSRRSAQRLLGLAQKRGRRLRRGLQKLSCARDFTHMVILDQLLNQRDRIGNVHEKVYYHFVDSQGRLDWRKKSSKVPGKVVVPLRRLILRDNEDGLYFKHVGQIVSAGLFRDIRHLDPGTYSRIQWLARLMDDSRSAAAVKRYFVDHVEIDPGMYEQVKARFVWIARYFARRRGAGKLRLDLDLAKAIRSIESAGRFEHARARRP